MPTFQPTVVPDSQHFVRYSTPDGSVAYVLTGVGVLGDNDLHGNSDGSWNRTRVVLTIPIPEMPSGSGFRLQHWAPFVTLNAISNEGQAVNAGWGVDAFHIREPTHVQHDVELLCDVAVSDSDGFILRLGYVVHLLGTFEVAGTVPH